MKKNRLAVKMALGLCVAFLAGGAAGANRALLVGINLYDPDYGASELECCINDVLGVRDTIMLADPDQRWQASSIQVLTNSQATAAAIRSALQALAAASQPNDLVVYFQSSHGGQYSGTSVYLCAYDQDYSAVSLGQDLSLFNPGVTVIVIVDACHSGGLFKQADGWPFAKMAMRAYTEAVARRCRAQGLPVPKAPGTNIAFMTACDYNQYSYERPPNGFYAGALINGCRDSAVDANHDGLYQFSELHTYAARVVSQEVPDQTAQYYNWVVLTSMVARAVGSTMAPVMLSADFDGDGKADPAIYHEPTGRWILAPSASGYALVDLGAGYLGGMGFQAMAADYDGDGRADPAIYQAASGAWQIRLSGSGYAPATLTDFGGSGYAVLAADFDGDRKADPALYHAVNAAWSIKLSGSGYQAATVSDFGGAAYLSLAADYDGDRKADPVVYLPAVATPQALQAGLSAAGAWRIMLSASGYGIGELTGFGASGYNALAADFDGDGKTDPAIQNPTTGEWQIRLSASGYAQAALSAFGGSDYGNGGAADYDGDGRADPALYRSAAGLWYLRLSGSGYAQVTLSSGYIP
jgi:hypothetical protein